MKIEIWSDVMCPFCYIGKRRFEASMAAFGNSQNIEIEWKSFLLNPELQTDPSKNIHQFLSEHKGISLEEAKSMNDYVANMAAEVGLKFDFDKAIPANSFNAHRFLHYTKIYGKQNEAEEALFKAYFTQGKNIDDANTLAEIAVTLGLDTEELAKDMSSDAFFQDVVMDVQEAREIGVKGVPFFVFNRKYAISGAQTLDVFSETLQKSFGEWQETAQPVKLDVKEGDSCGVDGENC